MDGNDLNDVVQLVMGGGRGGILTNLPKILMILQKSLINLIKVGTVSQISADGTKVKVTFDYDEEDKPLDTKWIKWATKKANNTIEKISPEIGEKVLLLCPEGNLHFAVIICSIFQPSYNNTGSSINTHTIEYRSEVGGSPVTDIAVEVKKGSESSYKIDLKKEDATYEVTLNNDTRFTMKKNKMTFAVGANKIEITDSGITTTVGTSKVEVTASEVTSTVGGSKAELKANGADFSSFPSMLIP